MTARAGVVVEPGLDPTPLADAARRAAPDRPLVAVVVHGDAASMVAAATASPDRVIDLSREVAGSPVAGMLETALEEAFRRHDLELIVFPATVRWREVAAWLAARLDGACVTDAVDLRQDEGGTLLADRLLYGGLVVATVALQRRPAMVTMAGLPTGGVPEVMSGPAEATELDSDQVKRLLERKPLQSETGSDDEPGSAAASPDLASANRIVAVGRGLQSREDLPLIQRLADALGAEIACSRPLTEDLRWLPDDRKIGLSGRTVRPQLYVAVGISGQIQHLVGMRDSAVIVAINSDPRAPIFEAADFCLVGDLYELVPRLTEALVGDRTADG